MALPGQGRREEPEWAVLLTLAVALVVGLVLQGAVLGRMNTAEIADGVVVSYPASWVRTSEDGALIAAADLNRGGPFGARLSVRAVPRTGLQGLGDSLASRRRPVASQARSPGKPTRGPVSRHRRAPTRASS